MSDSKSVSTTAYPRPSAPYLSALDTWAALGYAVVPVREGKGTARDWAHLSAHGNRNPKEPHHRAAKPAEVAEWRSSFADADRGALILDSRIDLTLTVVDVDANDPDLFAWVEATFGKTPLVVTSGRGRHFFYRGAGRRVGSSTGMIGPRDSFKDAPQRDGTTRIRSEIDVKASASCITAPGSWHPERQRPYTASQPITEALLQSLPRFNATVYERQRDMIKRLRRSRITAAELTELTDDQLRERADRDRRAVRMARNGFHVEGYEGLGPRGWEIADDEIVHTANGGGAATIGQLCTGSESTIYCPKHSNSKTPAAAVWCGSDGEWRVTCYGECATTWIVVDSTSPTPRQRDHAVDAWIDTGLSIEWGCTPVRAPFPYLERGNACSIFDRIPRLTGDVEPDAKPLGGPGGEALPTAACPAYMTIPEKLKARFAARVVAKTQGKYIEEGTFAEVAAFAAVFLRCPTGAGKTHAIRAHLHALSQRLGRPLWVISVSHRRTLVGELRVRLELLHTHMAPTGEVEITREKVQSLAVCADSLAAVAAHLKGQVGTPIDALILDEIESTLNHVHTCNRCSVEKAGIFDALRTIARRSAQIIAADANLSARSIDGVARLVGLPTLTLLSRAALVEDGRARFMLSPLDCVWLDHKADAVIAARVMAADRVAFFYASGSRKRARAIHAELEAAYPDRVWVLITGAHDHAEGRDFLADPNGYIDRHAGKIGGVIFTPALESGVSIDRLLAPELAAYGDTVIIDASTIQTAQSVIQASSRARRAGRWFIHAPAHGAAKYTSRDEMTIALIQGKEDSIAGVTKPGGWGAEPVPRDHEQFDDYVNARVHVDKSRVNLGIDLWSWLAFEGYQPHHPTVSPCAMTRKIEAKRLADRRDALSAADVAAVVAADDSELTVAQAEAILDHGADPVERAPAAKRLIREFYDMEPDQALVEFDDEGKSRGQIARWVDIAAALRGQADPVAEADRAELVVSGGATERLRRMVVEWATIQHFGITPAMFFGEGDPHEEEATIMLDPAAVHARVWGWCLDPKVRAGIKLHTGIDPWRQIPKAEREREIKVEIAPGVFKTITFMDALKTSNYQALADLTGLNSYKERIHTREVAVKPPENHTLNRILTATLARFGLAARSKSEWDPATKGSKRTAPRFDLERARMIRRLAAAHYERVTGRVLGTHETAAQMEARHEREMMRLPLCATPDQLAEVTARHRVESCAAAWRSAPVQPNASRIAALVSTHLVVRLPRELWAHSPPAPDPAPSVARLICCQSLSATPPRDAVSSSGRAWPG